MQTQGWRGETITSAYYTTRPKRVHGPADHHGVVVKTKEGNSYLIHNTPSSGVVTTYAWYMSDKWTKSHDIPVRDNVTVLQAMQGGYTPGTWNLGKKLEYAASGACIGTARGVENTIKKRR